jgi:HK97 family phage portal protein
MPWLVSLVNHAKAELHARATIRAMRKSSEWSRLWDKGLEHLAVRDNATDPYTQVADVYACVRAIANQAASVKYSLYDSEDNRVPDHELYDLFGNPNPHMFGSEFIETTFVYLESCGEFFWYLDEFARATRNGPEAPREITFLHPREMTTRIQGGRLIGWKWQPPTGGARDLSLEEVFQLGYPNPNDPIRGLSPLSAAALNVNAIYKAQSWQAKFFASGALPPFYVKYPREVQLTPDQIEVLKTQFRNEYLRGSATGGKVPFLFQGGELATVSPTQKEMDFLETIKHDGDQIGAVYGVPPVYRGIFLANFAIREQKRLMLYETVFPKLHFLGSGVQASIVDRFWPGLELRWEKKAKIAESIPEDVSEGIDAVRKLVDMGVPFSEAAKFLGLQIDTEGKPWLDVGYLPFNLMPASEVMNPPEPAALPAASAVPVEGKALPAHVRGARRAPFIRSLESLWEGAARGYRLRYQSWLYGLRTGVLAAMDAAAGQMAAAGGARAFVVVREVNAPDEVLFDLDEAAGELVRVSRPSWEQGLRIGGKSVIDELGIGDPFDMASPAAQAFLSDKAMKIKADGRIVSVVHERVRDAIQAGIDAREGLQDLKDRVKQAFNVERARALTIARTELGQSFAGGRYVEMQAEGVTKHQWLTAGDDEVRETHADQEGEIQVIGEPFSNGLLYPLQADSNDPGEVCNCRCAAVSVLE